MMQEINLQADIGGVELRVLGALEVGGVPREQLGGPRQQSLLVVLALAANRPVSRDRLVDLVWPEPPPSSAATLQSYVSHLRRAFAGTDVTIESAGPAYRMVLEASRVDALRFEQELAAAQVLIEAGRTVEAATGLDEALQLWRGRALEGFADFPFAAPAAARLEELRLAALTALWNARLAIGLGGSSIAELELLVREHPFNEDLWALLMRALYQAGRQSDALAAFTRARHALREELGLEPGSQLRLLEDAILRQDPSLEAPPAPRPPRVELPEQRRAVRRPPVPITPFVGRRSELGAVVELVRRSRAVTLVGSGGSGKTRLAFEAARRASGMLGTPEPIFADLSDSPDREAVYRAAGSAFGDGISSPEELEAAGAVSEHGGGVVILDNCEHVLPLAAELASTLLARSAVRVLATSRQPLELRNETLWSVPPMTLPDAGGEREAVLGCDAVSLFLERWGRSEPGFEPDDGELATVAELCRRLDGLPLALELAGSLARAVAAGDLLARLDERLHLLGGDSPDVHPRQRTLLATLEWSTQLLDREQLALFRRLGSFPGPFDLLSAERICGGDALPPERVFSVLAALVRRSLVLAPRTTERLPYRMLETVRLYAASLLRPEEAAELARRHAQLAAEANEGAGGEPVLLARDR